MRKEDDMVRTREEILNSIRERFSDDTSDEVIALIEDVSDTLTDLEQKTNDSTDWKEKYETNDKEWREKYKARFFEPTSKDDDEETGGYSGVEDENIPMTYDELFKTN